jgi:hypothetical protein
LDDNDCSLLRYLNPEVDNWLPGSATTVQQWVTRKYELYKEQIKQELATAKSKIHITVDLWTSTNHKSVLGIIGHDINQEGQLKHNVLGVKELNGSHKGENQGRLVIDVLEDFNIERKLGFFVGDNDGKNNTLCETLTIWMEDKLGINKFHRLRCNGHIINLSAQAFLFPELVDTADEAGLNAFIDGSVSSYTKQQIREWRKWGPLGKLHNIVVWTAGSSQREEAFKQLLEAKGLGLVRDNSTRWNSWYVMLERALKLRDAVDLWCFKNSTDLAEDTLTSDD